MSLRRSGGCIEPFAGPPRLTGNTVYEWNGQTCIEEIHLSFLPFFLLFCQSGRTVGLMGYREELLGILGMRCNTTRTDASSISNPLAALTSASARPSTPVPSLPLDLQCSALPAS
jgi:hypothetical protein